jgi:DNA modification methylase
MVAEALERRWIAIEMNAEYLDASKFRFDAVHDEGAAKRQLKCRSSFRRPASTG